MGHSTRQPTSASTDKAWAKGFLQEILKTQTQEIPEGFHTARQWGELWGMSRDTATRYINMAMKQGLMERRNIKVHTLGRTLYPVPHFGPVSRKAR